jgi:hypothetical protein
MLVKPLKGEKVVKMKEAAGDSTECNFGRRQFSELPAAVYIRGYPI